MAGRCALNADTVVRFHQGAPIGAVRNGPKWRNGNAAVCKAVMSRLDTGLHLQARGSNGQPAACGVDARRLRCCRACGRIAQRIERPTSNREVEGLSPSAITKYGELAERQGIAVLTRRDLRVGQVRLLHSPPICGSGIDGCASVFQTDQAGSLPAARSNSPR
jgi:hypothetical protein